MIQPRTQTSDYWGSDFTLTDSDIEQIYNHFLEVERPQTATDLARVIIAYRVAEETNNVKRLLSGRTIYQPQNNFTVDDELVFPALKFAHGQVTAVREGYNPQYGQFNVIGVEINDKMREFAADLHVDHPLNNVSVDDITGSAQSNLDSLYTLYNHTVQEKVVQALESQDEFIKLSGEWFVKPLMAEVNIGHLHLAEAVLEMSEGGPLSTSEIQQHLDIDPGVAIEVQQFSLNYSLLNDDRFDEVAPQGEIAWFLHRLEPTGVHEIPARLQYLPIPYDKALLSPQLLQLERELDDEWSELTTTVDPQSVVFCLLFPHRWAGTIPLSARIRSLLPPSTAPRQRIILIDEHANEEIVGWIVQEQRYIYGLGDWYEKNGVPIGGYVHLKPGPEPGIIKLNFDRRRAQREWVRLATVNDNRINFNLKRRAVAGGYDDLLIVGTDVVAAIDALWRRAETNQRSVSSLLAEIFPSLVEINPQNTVHAKTLYSAINMLRRVPPGPLFAELIRQPAFQPVGDHYWRFESNRWQKGD